MRATLPPIPTQQDTFTVTRDIEWEAINSTVRLEILVAVITIGPCSIREVAEMMNRPADGMYHHVRKLLKAGLIMVTERRKVGTQTEAVYQAVAKDITIDRNVKKKKTRERVIRLFRTILQQANREMESALSSGEAFLDGDCRNTTLKYQTTWLDDRQLEKVLSLQAEIFQIVQDGLQSQRGNLFGVLAYTAPIIRTRGSDSSQDQLS